MQISLNIILDRIKHYQYELYVDLPTKLSFRRVSLLPKELKSAQPDCLYVCRLSDAIKHTNTVPGLFCVCLRDRIHDERESAEALSGLLIINENIEFEQLYFEIQDTFLLINSWYEDMQEAIINKKSMQDILSLSEPVIGNFISITDSALTLLAYTKNISTDDDLSLFLIENGHHSAETVKKFKELGRFEIWMNNDLIVSKSGDFSRHTVVSKAFKFNETYFTHVVMTCNFYKLSDGLIDLFNILNYALSYYVKFIWQEEKDFKHVYNSFVIDLLEGKGGSKEAIIERAKLVGIRPNDNYIVMLLTGADKVRPLFPGRMARDITQLFPFVKPIYYNSRLSIFIHRNDIFKLINEQKMLDILNKYFFENNIFCGISDVFDDLTDMPEAYQQAEVALKESGLNNPRKDVLGESDSAFSNILTFNSCFASCLIDKSKNSEHIWKNSNYGRMLIALYVSDLEKNTNNLCVLYNYLKNERRAKETAEALHMHRNNVVYRISRIEEMLNISLDDYTTRINLHLSFLMFKRNGLTINPTDSPKDYRLLDDCII